MYDPTVGRWISEDPIGFEGKDANLYRYAYNDPLRYVDPDGLTGWEAWNTSSNHFENGILTTGLNGAGDVLWMDDQTNRVHTSDANYDRDFKMSFEFRFASGYTQGQRDNGDPISNRPGFYANSGIYIYNAIEVNIFDTTTLLEQNKFTVEDGEIHLEGESDPVTELLTGVPYGIEHFSRYVPNAFPSPFLRYSPGPSLIDTLRSRNPLKKWAYNDQANGWEWKGDPTDPEATMDAADRGWNKMDIDWRPCFTIEGTTKTLTKAILFVSVNGTRTWEGEITAPTKGGLSMNNVNGTPPYDWRVYIQSHHGSQVEFRKMNIN